MLGDPRQLVRDLLRGQDEIDATRRDRASWHRIVARRFVLGERDSAFGLDHFQAGRSVAGGAREDYADRPFTLIFGK